MLPNSIRNRAILAISLPVILFICVLSVVFYIYSYNRIKKETISHFSNIADLQKGQLEGWLKEREDVVRALAHHCGTIRILEFWEKKNEIKQPERDLCVYLKRLWEEDGYSTFILDKNGIIVCSAFPEFIGESRTLCHYFK